MITEAELRRRAAGWRIDPMVVDLDYSLGWFLAALFSPREPSGRLRLKGGTCLRKCHFANYRLSEDLDLTATAPLRPEELLQWAGDAAGWTAEQDGPDFAAAPPRLETIDDEYGSEAYQVRVYYRGPLRWGGSPRAIRLDVTRHERLLLPAAPRRLIHSYSDASLLEQVEIPCYPLEEILAEKLRAIGGQRRFAISRDLYDIHRLLEAGVSVSDTARILPAKFAARGVAMTGLEVDRLLGRRSEFEQDWKKRLTYLLPAHDQVAFESAWASTIEAVRLATGELP